jgi:hypothetical protein
MSTNDDLKDLLDFLEDAGCDRERVMKWIDHPLSELGEKTPRELVDEGHKEGLQDYVISISSGTVG